MKKNKIANGIKKKKKQRQSQTQQLLQKNRKPVNSNKASASWKASTILFFASLMTIILVVPTLIVVPFMSGEKEKAVVEKTGEDVELATGDSPFSVDVMRTKSKEIETVPLETYVSRVVASETPAEFELEALKAQSMAARTYIVNRLLYQDNGEKSDVKDTVSDQVYHNPQELKKTMGSDYDNNMTKIKKAVAATKGKILTYENEPITAAFFSTSNGYTENSEDYWQEKVPYLRSVKSPWDKNTEKFMEQKILTVSEVEDELGTDLPSLGKLSMEITRTDGERVDQLTMANESYTGRKIREELNLPSSDFSIEKKNDHLIFTTKGFGHGVGMSQFGANGMAEAGKTYKDILKHYYQGVNISTVANTAPALVAK